MQKKVLFVGLLVLLVVLVSCKNPTGATVHEYADSYYNMCLFNCETSPEVNDPKVCKSVCLDQLAVRMKEKAEALK